MPDARAEKGRSMKRRLPLSLMLAVILLGVGFATDARAQSTCNWNYCADQCDTYCTTRQQTCANWSFTGNTCNTVMTCSFMCSGGSGLTWTCPGPGCGGGSPIFRKQETSVVSGGPAREDSLAPTPAGRPGRDELRLLFEVGALACP